jgi:hypothetical protein
MNTLLAAFVLLPSFAETPSMNLLQNPSFEFHTFDNHRHGRRESFRSNHVAFWNSAAWGDITVTRESHVAANIRPSFSTHNLVSIRSKKKFWQFFTLPETGLAHGEFVSLAVHGYQASAGALVARIKLMKLDSEDGTWSPADYGGSDKRQFPRHSRGELVVAKSYDASSQQTGTVELKINGAEILGKISSGRQSHSDDINTIGLRVEFENVGANDAWIWWPSLVAGKAAQTRLPSARPMEAHYRHLPKTIQKLWKGEPIHIVAMGSSIDRGSANPAMTLYDEAPESPKFKQTLSGRTFEGDKVGRPDLDPYFGWWQHYFSYTGRLKTELMRKFDLTPDKVLLNFMACDGSCVGEAHSGLKDYCSLSLPPSENANGHKSGKTWQELYPELFKRREGIRPDLVIFGSGANEKTDSPDEVAVFEGTIRWIQRHYPNTEFLFCMWQNYGTYTPNIGDLQALALRYQIPMIDYGKIGDQLARWSNRYALVPSDGHPQAAAHYLWFKQIEKAFECWTPIQPGTAQLHLPERLHPNSYGWEGDMVTYDEKSPRIIGNKFIFDDTAINVWGDADDPQPIPYIDGKKGASRRKSPRRDIRNSLTRHGRSRLGDRHILELVGKNAWLTYVDAKVCPNRGFIGIENPRWNLAGAEPAPFDSKWGAPFGSRQVTVTPGKPILLEEVFTDLSVAYVDAESGGLLKVTINGDTKLEQVTNLPFTDQEKQKHFMENRKGILGLPFGLHTVQVEAVNSPVTVLGIFTYDSRSNRKNERRLLGRAAAGETVEFTQPFRARPLVICHAELQTQATDISASAVTFSGQGTGTYEIIGE